MFFLALLCVPFTDALKLAYQRTESNAINYTFLADQMLKLCSRAQSCHTETTGVALQYELMVHLKDESLLRNNDLYEFGVFMGSGVGEKLNFIRRAVKDGPHHVWAFDSFQGLPLVEDTPEHALDVSDTFSSWEEQKQQILTNINFPNTTLIKGFYNETLTEDLAAVHGMKPAWWVNLDCDLYISTYQALDWMFKKNLVRSGTRVYYDDILIFPAEGYQMRAHKEITEKYQVVWKTLLAHSHWGSQEQTPYFLEIDSYVDSNGHKFATLLS